METQRTPLCDFQIANDARMVPFAGWDMPVQYAAGIKAEHLATRNGARLFDVSHMVQVELSGSGANAFFERLTPTDSDAVAAEIQSIADGIWPKDNNPLVNAPHTADDIMDDDWARPCSRKQAGNPDGNHQENKNWPPVNRVNNTPGNRALICACPPMEFWEQQAAK